MRGSWPRCRPYSNLPSQGRQSHLGYSTYLSGPKVASGEVEVGPAECSSP